MKSRRKGTILLVVLLIIVALAGMVLSLGSWARVEAMTSANHAACSTRGRVLRAVTKSRRGEARGGRVRPSLPPALRLDARRSDERSGVGEVRHKS